MSNKTGKQNPLRTVAEAQFAHALKLEPHSAGELQNELEVHQIELEMQNEQLRQAQAGQPARYPSAEPDDTAGQNG